MDIKTLLFRAVFVLFLCSTILAANLPFSDEYPTFQPFPGPSTPNDHTQLISAAATNIGLNNSETGLHPVVNNYVPNEIIVKFKKQMADIVEGEILKGQRTNDLILSESLDKLNKKYKLRNVAHLFKNFKKRRQEVKNLIKRDKALLSKKEKRILRRLKRAPKGAKVPDLDRIYKIQLELGPDQSLQELIAAYNSDPHVEYAELNYVVSINNTPNDTFYPIQWPLNNTGQMYPETLRYNSPPGTADCDINAPEAWNINTGSSEIIVAVVDTGVDYTHRDLNNNIWANEAELNGATDVDDDLNGYIDDIYGYNFCTYKDTPGPDPNDDHGHGTHCAGVIAAEGNNSYDIAGVCWNARIMALKFLDAGGTGYTSDAVEAFYYAVENGADVVSNSWGGGGYSQAMQDAIDYAYSQGVIMVAAAGNDASDQPVYPAHYSHMISVAATNSNDQIAPFSNYGQWVDIAAPGVDILSLRANGTFMGATYDNYTTIASGTSMACPHISGACALILSNGSGIQVNEVEQILLQSADPISATICASGRLNVHEAMLLMPAPQGKVFFDNDFYSCAGTIGIKLLDSDIKGNQTQQVSIESEGGDLETLLLIETTTFPGVFEGMIPTDSEDPNNENGILQLSHGEIITVTYYDANDGTGNPSIATDTETADCRQPVISNVQIDVPGPEPTVTFQTNESTTARVLCGTECGEPNDIIATDLTLATTHTVQLSGVLPETNYYFIVEATDAAGNEAMDDNSGQCYAFTTDGPDDINVPEDYYTIQIAIDRSWNGGTVLVDDDTYIGEGNHDIDFKGKSITVSSENGPDNCTIDCQTSGRGFHFHSGEDSNSTLNGFTITNGYADRGGAILCSAGSPTISNCIIYDNSAGEGIYNSGGALYNNYNSNPILINCELNNNSASFGGGLYNYCGNPTLTKCTFSQNSASEFGGGMFNVRSRPTLTNCTFNENSAVENGGGLAHSLGSKLILINCAFRENTATSGGAISSIVESYPTLTNCTISENSASAHGGGLYSDPDSAPIITNSILWGNSDVQGTGEPGQINGGSPVVNYSCVQGWTGDFGGTGNIGDDPLFEDAADDNYHLQPGSPCIDAGNSTAVPPSLVGDLDDNPRLVDDPCTLDTGNGPQPVVDMGAYEDSGVGFLLSTLPIVVPEGATTTFTVALAKDPNEIIEVAVVYQSGDPDITVQSGTALTFNSSNYTIPQNVTLEAAEDTDYFSGVTLIWISTPEFPTTAINATEADNEPLPSVLYVDHNAPGANDGTNWTNAFTGLDEALSVAAAYQGVEEILVAQGKYTPAEPAVTRMATFTLVDGVTIEGGYAGFDAPEPDARDIETCKTILTGDLNGDDEPNFVNCEENSYHVITSSRTDETAVLDGFTIIAGNADGFYTESYGGGMYNWCGNATVINCTFSKNKSTLYGAGMYNYESSTRLTNCTFSENYGRYGGGMTTYNAVNKNEQRLTDCTFSENWATMWGGGLFNDQSHPILTNCIFSKNSAAYAGGMHNRLAGPKLSHCQFIDNFALHGGGGTVDDLAYPELTNCIFINNSTDGDGGGICCFGGSSTLTNCILWGNSANEVINENTQIYGEAEVNYNCIHGWAGGLGGTGNIGDEPLFVNLPGGDYHLMSDSSAIDAGNPLSDWSNEPWPNGERINMGVYGNTTEATRSKANFNDLAKIAACWLENEPSIDIAPEPDGDGIINFLDFALFGNYWSGE